MSIFNENSKDSGCRPSYQNHKTEHEDQQLIVSMEDKVEAVADNKVNQDSLQHWAYS